MLDAAVGSHVDGAEPVTGGVFLQESEDGEVHHTSATVLLCGLPIHPPGAFSGDESDGQQAAAFQASASASS